MKRLLRFLWGCCPIPRFELIQARRVHRMQMEMNRQLHIQNMETVREVNKLDVLHAQKAVDDIVAHFSDMEFWSADSDLSYGMTFKFSPRLVMEGKQAKEGLEQMAESVARQVKAQILNAKFLNAPSRKQDLGAMREYEINNGGLG